MHNIYGQSEFQSTHPARGATTGMPWRSSMERFQSTHPARGATFFMVHASFRFLFQSTHPARGATYNIALVRYRPKDFNPRTPRGVRLTGISRGDNIAKFQSTHPARGATCGVDGAWPACPVISIHAPREGCDKGYEIGRFVYWDFNPRTPRGVRPKVCIS